MPPYSPPLDPRIRYNDVREFQVSHPIAHTSANRIWYGFRVVTDKKPSPDFLHSILWVLWLPGLSAAWSTYVLMQYSLADFPGFDPAVKERPENTHEIAVFAVNPDCPLDECRAGTVRILTPVNHVVQLACASDAHCQYVAMRLAQALVKGVVIAEPGGIRGARERFNQLAHEIAGEWVPE